MFTRALHSLDCDDNSKERAARLKEMAKLLLGAGDQRASQVFDQACLQEVQIQDEREHSSALEQIAVALAQSAHFSQALEIGIMTNSATKAKVLKQIAISLAKARKFEDAFSVADALVFDSANYAETLCGVALALEDVGQTQMAFKVLERAVLAATNIPYPWSLLQASILEGIATQFAQASQVDHALAALNQIKYKKQVPRAMAVMAVELANRGDTRSTHFFGQALKLAEHDSDPGERAEALRDVALVLAKAHNRQASQVFERAVDSALKANRETGKAYPLQLVGEALAQSGAFELAVEVANQVERGWRRTPVLQALYKSFVLAGDQRAVSLFEKLLEEACLVSTYNGARDGVLESIVVDLIELNQRQQALKVVERMSVDSSSSHRIEARNCISKSFAEFGEFDEALSTLDLTSVSGLHDRVSVLIYHLASWAPAFEKLQVGLSHEILSEITRIGGWTSPAWRRIRDILTKATNGSGVFIPDVLTQPRREISVEELRESATGGFQNGFWEAAADNFQKLLDAGESLSDHAPKLIICLLNAHETLSPAIVTRIETLLTQLNSTGQSALAAPLREQLQAKLRSTRKKWWKFW
jgi:tetratricopeptide (TPR) repeat protein